MQKLILINPQWQGGGDLSTYWGAKEIMKYYLNDVNYMEVPIVCMMNSLVKEKNIIGYRAIKSQMCKALKILEIRGPETIVTIGGGCDADIPTIAYLNERLDRNLTILWFDAHADLNAPNESITSLFYGMPVRILLGDGGENFSDIVKVPLVPQQIINVGGRDLDMTEQLFITSSDLHTISVHNVITNYSSVLEAVQLIQNDNVYIHMDLDVIDPTDFSNTPLPVLNGLPASILMELLSLLKSRTNIVGLGLFEYMSCGKKNPIIEQLIKYI